MSEANPGKPIFQTGSEWSSAQIEALKETGLTQQEAVKLFRRKMFKLGRVLEMTQAAKAANPAAPVAAAMKDVEASEPDAKLDEIKEVFLLKMEARLYAHIPPPSRAKIPLRNRGTAAWRTAEIENVVTQWAETQPLDLEFRSDKKLRAV